MKKFLKVIGIIFAAVIVLIVGLVVLLSIGANEADKAIKNDGAKAKADISLKCGTKSDFGTYGFAWTITNSAQKAQDYVADVALYDAKGNQVGTLTILHNAVTAGKSVSGSEFLTDATALPTKCTVVTATAFEVS